MQNDRAALVESHAWIVAQFAAQYGRVSNGADLIEAGLLGLCEAAKRFRPGGGAQFRTYAWNFVKGRMLEEIRASHVVAMKKPGPHSRKLPRPQQVFFQTPIPERGEFGLYEEPRAEEAADVERRRRIARTRIAELPNAEHRRIAECALAGRSIDQIAQALGMQRGLVIDVLWRVERQLRTPQAA